MRKFHSIPVRAYFVGENTTIILLIINEHAVYFPDADGFIGDSSIYDEHIMNNPGFLQLTIKGDDH